MPRAPKRCGKQGCDELMPCPTHRPANHFRPARQQRGYDRTHEVERLRWKALVDAGGVDCARCRQPIKPGTPWDLDHSKDRTSYLGPSHARCNRAAH